VPHPGHAALPALIEHHTEAPRPSGRGASPCSASGRTCLLPILPTPVTAARRARHRPALPRSARRRCPTVSRTVLTRAVAKLEALQAKFAEAKDDAEAVEEVQETKKAQKAQAKRVEKKLAKLEQCQGEQPTETAEPMENPAP